MEQADHMLNEVQKGAIRQHLKKVLASSEFARSERAAAFLRFVVQQTLDQDSGSLKERQIGIAVFDRPSDWDPKLDTTVRTEARRLRKKLADYYASPAAEDQNVCITVPLGTYIPVFSFTATGDVIETFEESTTPSHTDASALIDGPVQKLQATSFRRLWLLGLIIIFGIAVASVVFAKYRDSTSHQAFRTVPLTSEYGHELGPSIAPDATRIAYVWDKGTGEYRIYIKDVTGGSPRRLTNGGLTELDPAWSPNGRQIAFLRVEDASTEIVVRDVDSGSEHMIGTIATQIGDWTGDPSPLIGNLGPAWTPDGQNVIIADQYPHSPETGVILIRISDGVRQQFTRPQGSVQDFLPKVSPDGRFLAFVRVISHGISDIYLLDLRTNNLKKLTKDARSINGLAWSHVGDQIIFSSDREGTFQLWTLGVANGVIRKLDTDSTTALDPQVAQKNDWIAYVTVNQNWNIDKVSVETSSSSSLERFIASSGRNHSARFSPDGKHVAFVSDRSGSWEIWLCDVACFEPQKLTDFRGPWIGGLSWSPDSTQLAFDARLGRKSAIYHLSISHPSPELFEKNSFEERMPSWSRDGRSLYFDSDRDGSVSIWKRNLSTMNVQKLGLGFSAREIDSNGDVFIGRSDGTIWEVNGATGATTKLPDGVRVNPILAWTTFDRTVYFCAGERGEQMKLMEYADGRVKQLAEMPIHSPRTSAGIDIAPDKHSLLITSTDQSSSNIYRRIGGLPN